MEYVIGQIVKAKHPRTSEIIELTAEDGHHPERPIVFFDSKGSKYILNKNGNGVQCFDDPPDVENVMWEITE